MEETQALIRAIVNRKLKGFEGKIKEQTAILRKIEEKFTGKTVEKQGKVMRASIAVMQSGKFEENSFEPMVPATTAASDVASSPPSPTPGFASSPSVSSVQSQLSLMERLHSHRELQSIPPFQLSVGVRIEVEKVTYVPCPLVYQAQVLTVYRVFSRLQGRDFPINSASSWSHCSEFLHPDSDFPSRLHSAVSNFDFSSENLTQLSGLYPFPSSNILNLTWKPGVLLGKIVHEAMIYAGLVLEKEPVWRKYRRLRKKLEEVESLEA